MVEFKTSENYNEGIQLKIDLVMDFVLKLDLLLNGNSSLTVTLQNRENHDYYLLHYITSDILITTEVRWLFYLISHKIKSSNYLSGNQYLSWSGKCTGMEKVYKRLDCGLTERIKLCQ